MLCNILEVIKTRRPDKQIYQEVHINIFDRSNNKPVLGGQRDENMRCFSMLKFHEMNETQSILCYPHKMLIQIISNICVKIHRN